MIPAQPFAPQAIAGAEASAATGLIHKYQGRALLIATGSCGVHSELQSLLHGYLVPRLVREIAGAPGNVAL